MKTFSVSPANFYDWQARAQSFDAMALYGYSQFAVTGSGAAENVTAGAVGRGFFDIVGVRPALGRVFRPDEDAPGRGRVAVLSDGFWKRHFAGSPDAVGRTLTLNGAAWTIVGVMPPRFSVKGWGVTGLDLWVPLALTPEGRAVRDNHNYQVIARLKGGVTPAQADAEMRAISKQLEKEYPQADAGWSATVIPLREGIVADVRLTLWILLAAVGLVLLIACANAGNLLFTRALSRRKEIAIRSALGAGRARVFRQLLVETLLLAFAGGAVGLALAHAASRTGAALLASQIPRADEIARRRPRPPLRLPALGRDRGRRGRPPRAPRGPRRPDRRAQGGGPRRQRRRRPHPPRAHRLRGRALGRPADERRRDAAHARQPAQRGRRLRSAQRPDDAPVALHSAVPTGPQIFDVLDRAVARLRAVPGVEAAGAIDDLPVTGGSVQPIVLEVHPELLRKDQPTVAVRTMRPGYLETMRIPLVRGRAIRAADDDVLLVSRTTAKLLWGDDDPIGRRVTLPLESKTRMLTVVGIVGDVSRPDLTSR